jgi:hypothetical protein
MLLVGLDTPVDEPIIIMHDAASAFNATTAQYFSIHYSECAHPVRAIL